MHCPDFRPAQGCLQPHVGKVLVAIGVESRIGDGRRDGRLALPNRLALKRLFAFKLLFVFKPRESRAASRVAS
jgi:hypothetical protein